MQQFKVIAKNKDETLQFELPVVSGSITWNMNTVNIAQVSVDFQFLQKYLTLQGTTARQLFETGWLNIYIFYGQNLVFAGFLADVGYQLSGDKGTINLGVKSWLGYFENRYYSGVFTQVDAGEIAWQCIDNVNDISITKGVVNATKDRDREYKYDAVAKSVNYLSADNLEDGFDFEITDAKVFNVYSSIGANKPYIRFDDFNVVSYSVQAGTVGSVFNRGTVLGAGEGELQLIQTYNAGSGYEDNWYIQELLLSETGTKEVPNLLDKITKAVELNKNVRRKLSLKAEGSTFQDYSVGDSVKVKLKDVELDEMRRITKKTITFGDGLFVDLEFAYD